MKRTTKPAKPRRTTKAPKGPTTYSRTATGDAREFANVDRWWEKRASYVPRKRGSHSPVEPFASPDDMWAAACEYFEWMETRPQYEIRPFHYMGSVTLKKIPKLRPLTIKGLLLFLDVSPYVWAQYKSTRGEGYATEVRRIEDVIYTQKFEGATADLFNAGIIARELGLKEHSEITGMDSGPIISHTEHSGTVKVDATTLTDEELDIIMKVIDRSREPKEEENNIGKGK